MKLKISKKVSLSCGSEPDRMVERCQTQQNATYAAGKPTPEVRTCQQPESGPGAKSMKAKSFGVFFSESSEPASPGKESSLGSCHQARVCVNGSAMKENEQRKLKVGDPP